MRPWIRRLARICKRKRDRKKKQPDERMATIASGQPNPSLGVIGRDARALICRMSERKCKRRSRTKGHNRRQLSAERKPSNAMRRARPLRSVKARQKISAARFQLRHELAGKRQFDFGIRSLSRTREKIGSGKWRPVLHDRCVAARCPAPSPSQMRLRSGPSPSINLSSSASLPERMRPSATVLRKLSAGRLRSRATIPRNLS